MKVLASCLTEAGSCLRSCLTPADQTGDIQAGDENYNMFSDPVDVKGDKIDPVSNYGTGLTPYILSLGLFVGALMITVVFDVKEPAVRPESAFGWFMSKFSVLFAVGILQGGERLHDHSLWHRA
jgi:putative membrane protein